MKFSHIFMLISEGFQLKVTEEAATTGTSVLADVLKDG